MKTIAVSERIYRLLLYVEKELGAKSHGEAIERLIRIYKEYKKARIRELMKLSRLPEDKVKELEEIIAKLRDRPWR
ncbi:MAG: antitoxin VapB family protein [Candidatus Baldrarchaeia archaeon]